MRDPSTALFQYYTNVINQGAMVGQNRPVGRVTIGKNVIQSFITNRGTWRSIRKRTSFPTLDTRANWPEVELPGIDTITIDRRMDQAAATCEIVLANTKMSVPEVSDFGIGNPGYLTANRGATIKDYTVEFQTLKNEWYDMLRPNRVIRTYQGYGTDDETDFDPRDPNYIPPWADSRLMCTGVWLIDSVTETAPTAQITLQCRDLAKLLIEQYAFPPLIDTGRWPLDYRPVQQISPAVVAADGHQLGKFYASSANLANVHQDINVYGHYAKHAFDGSNGTAWLSNGHSSPRGTDSYEWLQVYTGGNTINQVKLTSWGGPYTIYISVYDGTKWLGSNTIPYNKGSGADNGSALPYVYKVSVQRDHLGVFRFPTAIKSTYIRVTLTNLSDFIILNKNDPAHRYRAGIRELVVGYENPAIRAQPPKYNTGQPGVIQDYSEIVKEMLAWGGFYEPNLTPADPLMPTDVGGGTMRGGVWGDIESMSSAPVVPVGYDKFTNSSLMDVITFVKELHGAIFFVDEDGGGVFRLPNVWAIGNYITDQNSKNQRVRVSYHPIVIDESHNLVSISTVISDSPLRSDFLVIGTGGNQTGVVRGGYTPGYNAADPKDSSDVDDVSLLGGQTRVAALTGSPVTTNTEAERMAELLAMQAHFAYRTSTITAPCHPGLQLDDQIKVRERITNDSYIHYVTGLSTTMDLNSGQYTMDITTNWLGDDPTHTWILNLQENSTIVNAYDSALGAWEAVVNKKNGG